MDQLNGSVERVTFYNPENGYTVLRLQPERKTMPGVGRDGLVTVTGNLPEVTPGEFLSLQGRWSTHLKHGLQFQVEVCTQTLPATTAGIRRYLGSGLVKGIGPRLAERIVARFGKQTLDVIEHQPQLLKEVPDIGPKRARLIAAAWEEQKQVKELMLFLHSHNVSTNLAIKIYKQYGRQSMAIVQQDPYRLARDIYGVGFKTADRIAQDLGLPHDHPARLEAGLVYVLNQSADDGHVFLLREGLLQDASTLLGVPIEQLQPALDRLDQSGTIREDALPRENELSQAVYLAPMYHTEVGVAERLQKMMSTLPTRLSDLPPAFLRLDASLSSEQQRAIRTALAHPVSVLTGGPGTGKTTAMRSLIAALEEGKKSYALASPTGRAAKRLSQAAERNASTIHRLLGFSPGEGFKHHQENPLPYDFLVIDEVSMLDQTLALHLLKAISPGAHLLLVGDADQLPSVGAGDVLRDVIASGQVPVTRLSVIFRQATGSQIIINAHRINQGLMPSFPQAKETDSVEGGGDFFLFPAETAEEAAFWVKDVVCTRIPQKFNLHPVRDIQVLSPMYRGPAGVTALNTLLQESLNPEKALKPEKKLFGQVYRVGDKLMQIQNNYDKEVYNGDIGFLFGIDAVDQNLVVGFEGRSVTYDWSEADQLVLAYAVSVHKAQGSEFPAVVLPVVTQHYMMLQRNLLYTAVTRARKLCVLAGSRRALGIAVHNNQVARRNTALDWRLQRKIF